MLMWVAGCGLQSITEPHRVDPATEPTPVPTAVEISRPTYTVERGDVVREIRLSGQLVPFNEANLFFQQDGIVAEIFYAVGDRVESGEVIATLETSSYQNELFLAESALTVAEARLAAVASEIANDRRRAEIDVEKATLQLEIAKAEAGEAPTAAQAFDIQLKGLEIELAQLTLDELNAAVDPTLEAEVAQAALRVEQLTAQIENAQIIAPATGTITQMNIRAGKAANPDTIALILADLTVLEIRTLVSDEDLPLVALEMAGIVQLSGRPGDPFAAQIAQLPFNAGGTGEEENIVRFRLTDEAADGAFGVNDRVTVDLVVAEQNDVLWLAPQGLREFSGRQFVVVQEGSSQRRADVKTGLANDDRVEILSGLELGDVIVGQ